eukprot:2404910-Rhodomonas_salina.1
MQPRQLTCDNVMKGEVAALSDGDNVREGGAEALVSVMEAHRTSPGPNPLGCAYFCADIR